jgi:hypothetical protein
VNYLLSIIYILFFLFFLLFFIRILEENDLNLTNVEKSQLINLLPQKANEAFNLIPSLRDK